MLCLSHSLGLYERQKWYIYIFGNNAKTKCFSYISYPAFRFARRQTPTQRNIVFHGRDGFPRAFSRTECATFLFLWIHLQASWLQTQTSGRSGTKTAAEQQQRHFGRWQPTTRPEVDEGHSPDQPTDEKMRRALHNSSKVRWIVLSQASIRVWIEEAAPSDSIRWGAECGKLLNNLETHSTDFADGVRGADDDYCLKSVA